MVINPYAMLIFSAIGLGAMGVRDLLTATAEDHQRASYLSRVLVGAARFRSTWRGV
jgi:hypothetical protein